MSERTMDARLKLAKDLVAALETGDETATNQLLDEVAELRESVLFQSVGRLTRQIHDTMGDFRMDSKIYEMAEIDIPDAKERLNYVISMTEQAANQTMNVVEKLLPISLELNDQANELAKNWKRFLVRKMPFEEFKGMSQEITEHFDQSIDRLTQIQTGLNEVLMAQSFQDITGQIIRRVIDLVQNLETNMVELIRIAGGKSVFSEKSSEPKLPGPVVPGVDDKNGEAISNQDDVDDLLSSLGF